MTRSCWRAILASRGRRRGRLGLLPGWWSSGQPGYGARRPGSRCVRRRFRSSPGMSRRRCAGSIPGGPLRPGRRPGHRHGRRIGRPRSGIPTGQGRPVPAGYRRSRQGCFPSRITCHHGDGSDSEIRPRRKEKMCAWGRDPPGHDGEGQSHSFGRSMQYRPSPTEVSDGPVQPDIPTGGATSSGIGQTYGARAVRA